MLNLKKTTVAVLAFGSSVVLAGSMGPVCSSVNVTTPCETVAWDLGAKALYLQPSYHTEAGFSRSDLLNGTAAQDVTARQRPGYIWGFEVEGSYHFNTGNDLNINWYHINNSSTKTFGSTPPVLAFGSTTTESLSVAGLGGSSSLNTKWDAVNMEFGQLTDFSNNKSIRFHGGAQYAHLANNITKTSSILLTSTAIADTFVSTTTVLTDNATSYNPSFSGGGPRIGMDMDYGWNNGLSIYANGATGLLAGSRKFNATFSDNLGRAVSTQRSETVVVPVMDAKLGATYTRAIAQGDVTLDAGWMWVDYFNAQTNLSGADTNISFQGPFVGMKWLGNLV